MKQRYNSYKSSGIDWIGDIPSHWKVEMGKYLLVILPGYPADSNLFVKDIGFPLIRIRDIDSEKTEINYSGDFPANYIIEKDDILVGMDGDFNIAKWKGSRALLNQRVCKISGTKRLFDKFAFYVLPKLLKRINDVTYATTVKHLSTYDISNSKLPLPPLAEQEAIAAWLDEKCEEIDAAIAKVDREIELIDELKQSEISRVVTRGLNPDVPLRPSGIDWIGDIPECWRTLRLKYLTKFNPSPSKDLKNDTEISYAPMDHVRWGKIVEDSITWGKRTSGLNYFEEGDILMAKVTPCFENGNIAIARNLKNGCGVCSSELFVFRPYGILNKLLFYTLQHSELKNCFVASMRGTGGLKRIEPDVIYNFFIPTPPLYEQQEIADYLDKKCAEIDGLKAKLTKKRETLMELRQSIISEVVTGKRKVI